MKEGGKNKEKKEKKRGRQTGRQRERKKAGSSGMKDRETKTNVDAP